MNKLIPIYQQLIVVLTKLRATLMVRKSSVTVSMFHPLIIRWAQAIASQEGAKQALNNPGNLKVATLTKSWGAEYGFKATDGGWIAKFPTYQQGFDALCNFLTLGAEDMLIAFHSSEARTLEGFSKIYAGNPPQTYIDAVGQQLGCSLDTQISSFIQ